jgi:acetyltransferase-like isoleucine patch superfamily enzyme
MYAPLEDFTVAVARLSELRDEGLLRLKVSAAGGVAFAIDKSAENVPPQGDGLFMDIYDTLGAIATSVSIEDFVRARSGAAASAQDAEDEAVSRSKYEAAASAFPARRLRPKMSARVRARAHAMLVAQLIALLKRSGRLGRLMGLYAFRRALGVDGRRAAWIALGARIAETASVGPGVWLRVPSRVSVGAGSVLAGRMWVDSYGDVTIGSNVLMNEVDLFSTQHDVDHPRFKGERRSISIGDYAWLPNKIIVLPGVSIGSHAVIGTGSVVSSDIPDYGIAAGNPARVIKERARIRYTYVPSSVHRGPLVD